MGWLGCVPFTVGGVDSVGEDDTRAEYLFFFFLDLTEIDKGCRVIRYACSGIVIANLRITGLRRMY